MPTPANPGRMLLVTLPVADVERSRAFVAKLGFSFDPAFSGEGAAEEASVSTQNAETAA